MAFTRFNKILPLFLAAILFLAWLPVLGIPDIAGSTEAREVHVSRVVFEKGELILPLRNGIIPSKPPLLHWLSAFLAKSYGEFNVYFVRLVSLLAGFFTLVVAIWISRGAFSRGEESPEGNGEGTLAPLFAFVTCAGTPMFLRMMGEARVDMLFCLFVTGALWAVIVRKWAAFFTAAGFAVLAKGPLGLFLSGLFLLLHLFLSDGLRIGLKTLLKPRVGWFIFVSLVLPWYLLAYRQGGEAFLWRVGFENWNRLATGHRLDAAPWWFYIETLLLKVFPASLFFVFFLLQDLASLFYSLIRRSAVSRGDKNRLALALWFVLSFITLSFAAGKREAYLLPLIPALCVYVSLHLSRFFVAHPERVTPLLAKTSAILIPVVTVLQLLSILSLALLPFLSFSSVTALKTVGLWFWLGHSWYLLAVILVIFLSWRAYWVKRRESTRVLAAWQVAIVLGVFWLQIGLALKAELKAFSLAASMIKGVVPNYQAIEVRREGLDEYFDPVMYYLGREVVVVPLESKGINCENAFLVKGVHVAGLMLMAAEQKAPLKEAARFRQPADRDKARTERDIVVLKCEKAPVLEGLTSEAADETSA